jgi:hypothetical protein
MSKPNDPQKRNLGKKEIRIFLDEAEQAALIKIADIRKISVHKAVHEAISTLAFIDYEFSCDRVVIFYEHEDIKARESIPPSERGKRGRNQH